MGVVLVPIVAQQPHSPARQDAKGKVVLMDSAELSRKVAEAMGITPCALVPNLYAHRRGVQCDGEGECRKPFIYWPDLADARDRDAAIAWLNAQGFLVVTRHRPDGSVYVRIQRGAEVAGGLHLIEEAFGRAFLAAMGAGE